MRTTQLEMGTLKRGLVTIHRHPMFQIIFDCKKAEIKWDWEADFL